MVGANQKPNSFKTEIFILATAVALVNTGFAMIFPIYPKLVIIIGGGDALDLGLLAASFGISGLIGAPIFGYYADNYGKKPIMLIGMFGFILSQFVYVSATNLESIFVARAIQGFFVSAIFPPAIALVSELSPQENRGRYLGYLTASQTVGIIIGPLIGGFLYEGFSIFNLEIKGSLYLPFYTSAVLGLISLVWSAFKLPTSSIRRKSQVDSIVSLKRERGWVTTLKRQIQVLPNPKYMILIFGLGEILAISAWLTIEPGFIFYFYEELFLTPSNFGLFVSAFGVFAVLGQTLLGNLSDRYGRKRIFVLGQFFSLIFYILLSQATTMRVLVFSTIFAGIGFGLRDPALKALLSDVTKEENRATVFGIEAAFLSLSQIVGPIIGGFLYISRGMDFLFTIAIIISFVNIFALSLIQFTSPNLTSKNLTEKSTKISFQVVKSE